LAKKIPHEKKPAPPAETARRVRLAAWIERHAVATAVVLVAFASLRIAATYTVFNHTIDEPAHIACGIEWLQKGTYTYEAQHPPLARIAAGLLPYLAGRRMAEKALAPNGELVFPAMYQQGAIELYGDNHYDRNLALARLGILPFFWIAAAVVFLWGRKAFGNLTAVTAVFIFTFVPSILAHGGLATTDMALAAFVGASFFTGLLWAERPDVRHSLLFGVCTALAVLSKFSSLLFVPGVFAAALLWHLGIVRRPSGSERWQLVRTRALPFAIAIVTGILVVWAGYRFSFGPSGFGNLKLPAPQLFAGIREVAEHNAKGHPAYLLGMRSMHGWWYYYPVALAVKTPLAVLALFAAGVVALLRRFRTAHADSCLPLMFFLGILIPALFTHVNIGVRHVLPIYFGISLTAAAGAVWLWENAPRQRWTGWTLGVLLLWLAATSILNHPDYIPYTNALAGDHPENVLIDSDLDWGQDMKRLSKRLHELGARQVAFNPLIVAYLEAVHGFPRIEPMYADEPSPGWNAASITVMKAQRLGLGEEHPEIQIWTDRIPPTERVGKTTYLWYIPPGR
jgi:hypothetical protein